MSDYGMIINGQKIHTENTFSVLNPANEEVLAECPIATREHLDQAVEAASRAFESWSKVSDKERAAVCGKISDAIASHSEELAKLKCPRSSFNCLIQMLPCCNRTFR